MNWHETGKTHTNIIGKKLACGGHKLGNSKKKKSNSFWESIICASPKQ